MSSASVCFFEVAVGTADTAVDDVAMSATKQAECPFDGIGSLREPIAYKASRWAPDADGTDARPEARARRSAGIARPRNRRAAARRHAKRSRELERTLL